MTELLNCPFCGGNAKLYSEYESGHIGCQSCYISTASYGREEDAAAAWNQRAPLHEASRAVPKFDKNEFEEMVKRGTKAWADVPDNFVEELRGGSDDVTAKLAESFGAAVEWAKEPNEFHHIIKFTPPQLREFLYRQTYQGAIDAAVLAEREACALVCEKIGEEWADPDLDKAPWASAITGCRECREAIQARGNAKNDGGAK